MLTWGQKNPPFPCFLLVRINRSFNLTKSLRTELLVFPGRLFWGLEMMKHVKPTLIRVTALWMKRTVYRGREETCDVAWRRCCYQLMLTTCTRLNSASSNSWSCGGAAGQWVLYTQCCVSLLFFMLPAGAAKSHTASQNSTEYLFLFCSGSWWIITFFFFFNSTQFFCRVLTVCLVWFHCLCFFKYFLSVILYWSENPNNNLFA